MNFVDAQHATELRKHLFAKGVAIKLPDCPIHCCVHIPRGQIQLVLQNSIDDCLANLVVVFRFEVHTRRMTVKRLATVAFGNILTVDDFKKQNFLIAQRTDKAMTLTFATAKSTAFWTSHLPWSTANLYLTKRCFLASMPVSLLV